MNLRDLKLRGRAFMPDGFRGLGIGAPDYWAPLSLVGNFRPAYAGREDETNIEVIGRLRAGVSPETAAAGLTVWASGQMNRFRADPASSVIQLEPTQGTLANYAAEALLVFVPLFLALA